VSGPARILLVEDQVALRRLMRLHLAREGFAIVEAGTLAEARERLAEGVTVGGLVVDGTLPDGDGLELVAELRADRRSRDVPVFVVSGRAMDEERARGIAAGATAYFPKPVDWDGLIAAVRGAVRGASA
jgi:DNA-binding response OmpR family regulator